MRREAERSCIAAAVMAVMLFSFGCRTAGPDERAVAADLVWPASPAEPRVRYVKSFSSSRDLGFKLNWLRNTVNFITGSEKGRERFVKPFSVCFDEEGNMCVSDTGSMSIHYFDFAARKSRNWKSLGKVRLEMPVSVAKHEEVIYVADSSLGKILASDEKGRLLFTIEKGLKRPVGLAIHAGRLYAVDSQLHKVVVFTLDGKYISEHGGRGGEYGRFNYPTHIALDNSGRHFVTDSLNHRVQILSSQGMFIKAVGSAGDSSGHFNRPKGVSPDNDGHIYVVDAIFDNIQVFDDQGRFLMVFGSAGTRPGEFWMPTDIEYSDDRHIYVTDTYNRRIQVFRYIGE